MSSPVSPGQTFLSMLGFVEDSRMNDLVKTKFTKIGVNTPTCVSQYTGLLCFPRDLKFVATKPKTVQNISVMANSSVILTVFFSHTNV